MAFDKLRQRRRRHQRIRQKVVGTSERPRMCVHKSLKHIYVQLIDDQAGRTLAAVSSNRKELKAEGKSFRNIATAKRLGREIGEKAQAAGIASVVFDRGGFLYHGCIKALAEAARESGLKF